MIEFNIKLEQLKGRQITGYIGIINEATTCYMNSMLQSLFVIGQFKNLLFKIQPSNDSNDNNENNNTENNSVILSLQRLFYDLMYEDYPVSINHLLDSFGWGRAEASVQHDVQEFNLLISDQMQKSMKGTPLEGEYSYLFEGVIENCIKCLNVNYTSKTEEKFVDLSLTIKVYYIT